jgi:dihydrofolate reductase
VLGLHAQDAAVGPGADIPFVQGDVSPVHQEIAQAAGDRNVWLVGSGELVGQFADCGLLDEVRVSIAPVTLDRELRCLPVG